MIPRTTRSSISPPEIWDSACSIPRSARSGRWSAGTSGIRKARATALQGANILLYPTAIGWHPAEKEKYGEQQLDAWKTMQRSHAIANGCWVAAVNRVGLERLGGQGDGIQFWGHSFVCDPFGVVVAEAGKDEALVLADVDLTRVEEVRRHWPFLRDRRTDAYSGIQHRFLTD